MARLIQLKAPVKKLTLRQHFERRNKVLMIRETGGLGDILMTRMLFEDFKRLFPESEITYALPKNYHSAVVGHPYIDHIVDSSKIDESNYAISFNITSACGRYESIIAPKSDKHRSDIWADYCGFSLTRHEMHLSVSEDYTRECRLILEQYRTTESGPLILLSPISAMISKNLDEQQMNDVADGLRDRGCLVVASHKDAIPEFRGHTFVPNDFNRYLGIVNAADYIVSVDTATFHAANGLKKPTVGIFTWADGKIYGKYHPMFILVQRHRDNGNWDCGPCYFWSNCPKSQHPSRKPCAIELTASEIISAVDEMMMKWPIERQ